ncbi:MAG: hypothetical protein H6Q99_3540 [Proteobacteria bacterium]|nr:hypothetical protein [Pseudomonadota bacterium]
MEILSAPSRSVDCRLDCPAAKNGVERAPEYPPLRLNNPVETPLSRPTDGEQRRSASIPTAGLEIDAMIGED